MLVPAPALIASRDITDCLPYPQLDFVHLSESVVRDAAHAQRSFGSAPGIIRCGPKSPTSNNSPAIRSGCLALEWRPGPARGRNGQSRAKGSRNKYEYDHQQHAIFLDRVLFSSVHYPTDYGFIPGTLSPDGDPLDVLLIVHEPTFPGCHVTIRPIGLLEMRDEKGRDTKILAVPIGDPRFDEVRDLTNLPAHWLREIENFFDTYKRLEDKETQIVGWGGVADAWQVVEECRTRGTEGA